MLKMRLSPEIRAPQEFQSALIRLSIWAFMLPMLGIARHLGDYVFTWTRYQLLFGVHLVWYSAILVSTVRRPQLWPARTYLAILADLSGVTWTIYLTGDATGPFFLIYAVSFLSQSMRYGRTNLLIASLCSLFAYTSVAAILGDWRTQTLEVLFVSLVLVVLPAYEYLLLRRLQSTKQAAETANRARGLSRHHDPRAAYAAVWGDRDGWAAKAHPAGQRAARVPRFDQCLGRRAAGADRRHPGSVQDRCRQAGAQALYVRVARVAERNLLGAEQPGLGQGRRAGLPRVTGGAGKGLRRPIALPPDPVQPDRQCDQVHRTRAHLRACRGHAGGPRGGRASPPGVYRGYRDRYFGRPTATGVRQLLAGRPVIDPAVRWQQPGDRHRA